MIIAGHALQILASTVHDDSPAKVLVYDSLYDNVDVGTQAVIRG